MRTPKVSAGLTCLSALILATVLGLLPEMSRAAAPDVQVLNLFDTTAFVPGVLLPFQLTGALTSAGSVSGFAATVDNGADCRMMKDPYLSNTFILKCQASASVALHFSVSSGGQLYQVDYGPFAVVSPGQTVGVPPTPPPPTPAQQGLALWQTFSCSSCHGAAQPMPGHVSPSDIATAFQTHNEMAVFRGLSQSDISLLAAYLQSL